MEEFEHKKAVEVYIPIIAYNLAQVVSRVVARDADSCASKRLRELLSPLEGTAEIELKLKSAMIDTLGTRPEK
jgi:hypothetical protein